MGEVVPEAFRADMAERLRVLAHADRLRIVEELDARRQAPVHELVRALGMPQASVSNHLSKMRRAGIIRAQRKGKEMWYSILDRHAATIVGWMRKQATEG